MPTTGQIKYGQETLAMINKVWRRYKEENNATQQSTAKAMQLSQAALSKYLNGDLPLNTDFIQLFVQVTGADIPISPIKATIQTSVRIELKYSLSGTKPEEKFITTHTPIPGANHYGILVDLEYPLIHGAILVVDPDDDRITDKDLVVLVKGKKVIFGRLEFRKGWVLVPQVWGQDPVPIDPEGAKVQRISSILYPKRQGKKLK